MNADHAFFIGKTHRVCEDYARSGVKGDMGYAILADGCSSSKDSDIGARLLVLAVEQMLLTVGTQLMATTNYLFRAAVQNANSRRKLLGLHRHALDATLLFVTVERGSARFAMYGDGALGIVHPDGELELITQEYSNNFPFYLSYYLDDFRLEEFLMQDGQRIVRKMSTVNGQWESDGEETYALDAGPLRHHADAYADSIAFITSDGVQSFHRVLQTETGTSFDDVSVRSTIRSLTEFHGIGGQFVQRRLGSFLRRQAPKLGWIHNDDLSMGAVVSSVSPPGSFEDEHSYSRNAHSCVGGELP